jgi:hypothetical protein
MLNKYSISSILLLLLQSCGSGGSDDSSTSSTSEYQFKLSAHITNKCGQPMVFNQFEVHLQDDSWKLVKKYNADVNGQVSFTTNQENINYTIVAKSQQEQNEEGLDIVSYYQANTTVAASYEAKYDSLVDNSSCECVSQDIEVQHREFSAIDTISASFNYESWYRIDSKNTYLKGLEICRAIDDEWTIQSISIRGFDSNNKAIGVASLIEDFSSNAENLWQTAAIEVADNVALPKKHVDFEISQIFANNAHFYADVNKDDTELLIFNTHPYISESIYYSVTSLLFEKIDTIFGQSTFSSHHQIKSSLYDQAFDVSAKTTQPNIDNSTFSELTGNHSYDYSEVSGYPLVAITLNYQVVGTNLNTSTPITWTMYGPIKGTLASSVQLSGYENTITPDTSIKSTDIKIIKSTNSNKYEDYINYYQGNQYSDLADNLYYFQLELLL